MILEFKKENRLLLRFYSSRALRLCGKNLFCGDTLPRIWLIKNKKELYSLRPLRLPVLRSLGVGGCGEKIIEILRVLRDFAVKNSLRSLRLCGDTLPRIWLTRMVIGKRA